MNDLTKNISFLKSVIYHMAETMYQDEIVDTEMEESIIGDGCEYSSKEDWIQDRISEHLDNVSKNITPMKNIQEENKVTGEIVALAEAYYGCPLGEKFRAADGSEIKRVPGGWILSTTNSGTVNPIYIPFNDEFQWLVKK
jgi:hypothetical protein